MSPEIFIKYLIPFEYNNFDDFKKIFKNKNKLAAVITNQLKFYTKRLLRKIRNLCKKNKVVSFLTKLPLAGVNA